MKIEEIEKLPDERLNTLIFQHVDYKGYFNGLTAPDYCNSTSAAFDAVRFLENKGFRFEITSGFSLSIDQYQIKFYNLVLEKYPSAFGETLPKAIAKAVCLFLVK